MTGKQKVPRVRKKHIDDELTTQFDDSDWPRKLPVDIRILLIQLLNIESKVARSDAIVPITTNTSSMMMMNGDGNGSTLKELFEKRPIIDGRRNDEVFSR